MISKYGYSYIRNPLSEMPFYGLTDFQLIWENETRKQMILNMMENNGFKEFMKISTSSNEIKTNLGDVKYYDIDDLNTQIKDAKLMKILHFNCRMLAKNRGNITGFLKSLDDEPDIIILSEIGKDGYRYLKSTFPNYQFEYDLPKNNNYGGVAILALNQIYDITINPDLKLVKTCNCSKCQVEDIWLNLSCNDKKYTIGAIYRHPNGSIKHFSEQLAESINQTPPNSTCIVGGDINIDLLNISNEQVLNYATLFMSCGFVPKINLPTRITDHSCTLIDHIFLRLPNKYKDISTHSGCIFSDISDHLPLFLGLTLENKPSNNRPFVRIINDRTIEIFKNKCKTYNWDTLDSTDNVDDKYNIFQQCITDMFEESFPLVKQSRKRNKDKKWMTSGLLKSIRHKHRLYKKQIKNPTQHNKTTYADYKRQLDIALRLAEEKYFFDMFKDTKNSSIKLWKCLGNIINPNKKSRQNKISKMYVNGEYIEDDELISNHMNDYFCNIGINLANELPPGGDHNKYLKNKVPHTMFLSPIDEVEIGKEISKMNSKKSPGPDNISPKILKYCEHEIKKPLTKIFNSSIESAIYPTQLKIAKVIALYKKKSAYLAENYRPISLLSCIDKLFEKLLHKRFMDFIKKYEIIILEQFGFLPKHSTTHALIEVIDTIRKTIDNGEYALGIYLDLKKAFDTVDHKILLSKLEHYGFRGHTNNFLKSYLSGRHQFTVVNGKKSSTNSIETGVPQGSVLGPLLFIVYINDIINCITDGKTTLFADDTSILLRDKNLNELKRKSEKTLKDVYDWLVSNKLTLSWEKTFFVIYHSPKRSINNLNELHVYNNSVKRVKSVKYLGMTIDETLSWNNHVTHICNLLSRNFHLFYNIRNILPNHLKKTLYYSLVYSHVQYGIELYGACRKNLLNKPQTLQNKLLKVLYNLPFRTDTNYLHSSLNILKVKDIYKMNILKFVYDSINHTSIKQFHNYYRFQHTIHNRNLRQNNRLYPDRVRTKYGESTLHYSGTKIWNTLHQKIRSCPSMNTLKKAFRISCLNRYT